MDQKAKPIQPRSDFRGSLLRAEGWLQHLKPPVLGCLVEGAGCHLTYGPDVRYFAHPRDHCTGISPYAVVSARLHIGVLGIEASRPFSQRPEILQVKCHKDLAPVGGLQPSQLRDFSHQYMAGFLV